MSTSSSVIDPKWIRGPVDQVAIDQGCWFDSAAGEDVCDFIETFCRQSKGEWEGRPLQLLDWQRDFLMRLFGWKRPDGRRRYRRFYLEIAKKNGKSTMLSAVALCLLLVDGEGAPEVYLNACDRLQARIVYDEAKRMVESSPDLSKRLQVIDTKHRIVHPEGNGAIIANSAEAPNKDGLNPSATFFDELHRQPNHELWDVFAYASAARRQPLLGSITTAGESESGVWFEQRDYSERVNRGEIEDITHLGVIYRAGPKDDLDDPATWRKANPSLGQTITEEDFARELKEAKDTPRKLANFLRLRLNIVSNADTLFIPPEEWKACDSPRIHPAALRGLPCYAGGDLSKTTDLTALVLIWGNEERGYDLVARFWMPAASVLQLARRDRVPYDAWIREGWITATPGEVVDYAFMQREINELASQHDLRKALFDPYNATDLVTRLREQDGINAEFLRQGFLSLSPPSKQLERLIKTKKIRHGGNPVMRWMMSNAVVVEDSAGNIKLDKKKSRKKIDGPTALVNAIAAAMADPDSTGSVYDNRGVLVL